VIHPDQLGYEMEQVLDNNALLVTENAPGLQGKHDFLSYGPRADQKQNIGHAGGSLGWGVGAAIGAKLAAPDRQVVLSIGDGSLMYSAGGFWSMARHSTAVLTIVWNNHNYQTVRSGAYRYNRRMVDTGKYPGLYLGDPDIDFVGLAASQGVRGQRVTNAADIAAALKKGTEETRAGSPYLVEVVVSRVGGGAESTWYQKVKPGTTS
jgi:benzoylformate decarboxylase